MTRNKAKLEHTKEHFISEVLNVQVIVQCLNVRYFQFEYYCAFLNSINIKTTSSANEFLMHNQQNPL